MPPAKKTKEPITESGVIPGKWDDKYTEYLLEKLRPDEMDLEGNPVYKGLKRLVEEFEGEVIENTIMQSQFGSSENGYVSGVTRRIVIKRHDNGELRVYDDVASVSTGNTDEKYARFGPETASTRAESRVFRKILNLNVLAAEETTSVPISESGLDGLISTSQIRAIRVLCKRNNINLIKFIKLSEFNYTNVNTISNTAAKSMIEFLNLLQQNPEKIKKLKIEGYDENWENESK